MDLWTSLVLRRPFNLGAVLIWNAHGRMAIRVLAARALMFRGIYPMSMACLLHPSILEVIAKKILHEDRLSFRLTLRGEQLVRIPNCCYLGILTGIIIRPGKGSLS